MTNHSKLPTWFHFKLHAFILKGRYFRPFWKLGIHYYLADMFTSFTVKKPKNYIFNYFSSDNYPIPILKQSLYRTPSAPPATFPGGSPPLAPLPASPRREGGAGHSPPEHLPYLQAHHQELFKPSELHWADVASNTGKLLVWLYCWELF